MATYIGPVSVAVGHSDVFIVLWNLKAPCKDSKAQGPLRGTISQGVAGD